MGNNSKIIRRLNILNFIEFAIWGCYLVSMGIYLGRVGMGAHIFWFYTAQGLVSLFMPAVVGIIADRWIPAQKMLSLCHGMSALFMLCVGWYGLSTPHPEFGVMFSLYVGAILFFMPTIGLCNSVAFNALIENGHSPMKKFPAIRVWGTVGFICAELFVNFTHFADTAAQYIAAGVCGLLMAGYAITMPACPINKAAGKSLAERFGLNAFALFRNRNMALFFIFSMLLGVCLQITNSYGTLYINSFQKIARFANDWAAQNATALTAISQASEALCILLIPMCIKRFGIKGVIFIAMMAWVLRFGFFSIGNTGSGVVFLILSCIVYGVAFDFFNVAGGLFVEDQTDSSIRSSAQGLFMLMTNGLGASIGTFIAGNYVVNKLVNLGEGGNAEANLVGWEQAWGIFAAYAFVIGVLFFFIFKTPKNSEKNLSQTEIKEMESISAGDPEGMTEMQ